MKPDTSEEAVKLNHRNELIHTHAPDKLKDFTYSWTRIERVIIIIFVIQYCLQFAYFSYETVMVSKEKAIYGVEPGYFGFKRDSSDFQWNAFSDNLPILVICAAIFLVLSKAIKSSREVKNNNFHQLFLFYCIFGFIFIAYMFRGGVVYWILFTYLNYYLTRTLYDQKYFIPAIWVINLVTLYFNEQYHGYDLRRLFPNWQVAELIEQSRVDSPLNWNIIFNMTILKMISFACDKRWAHTQQRVQSKSEHLSQCKACTKDVMCLRYRQDQSHDLSQYNLLHYYAYLLYTPTFIAGPPLTFNAFYSQVQTPQNTHSRKQVLWYGLRTLFVVICMEVFVHINYSFAIITKIQNEHIWSEFNTRQLVVISASCLQFIYLKFNAIWKLARCWALFDDVEVPENMNRCMHNGYNYENFWRSWHRGFNQWLIRYIFIPLGGKKTKIWNIWVIFTFVAIWHDMNLNLILWAWSICFFLIPEIMVKRYFQKPQFKHLWKKPWWKYLCALCGGIYEILMVFSNLIGFGMGYKILIQLLSRLATFQGLISITEVVISLSMITLQMFYIREGENEVMKGL